MKTVESKQASVERGRPVFIQIGFIIALAASLVAFEWKTYEKTGFILTGSSPDYIIEEFAPLPMLPKPPAPPVTITQFRLNPDPEIDLPDINIDAGIDLAIADEPYAPPPLVEEQPVIDNTPHAIVEVMPEFPGGEAALYKFLSDNLRYPAIAKGAGITGTVYTSFVVERDGSVSHVEILRGLEVSINEEAIRVIKTMPLWKPGIQAGRPVRVKFNMGIKFVLL